MILTSGRECYVGLGVEVHADVLRKQVLDGRLEVLVASLHALGNLTQAASELVDGNLRRFLREQPIPVVEQRFLRNNQIKWPVTIA